MVRWVTCSEWSVVRLGECHRSAETISDNGECGVEDKDTWRRWNEDHHNRSVVGTKHGNDAKNFTFFLMFISYSLDDDYT